MDTDALTRSTDPRIATHAIAEAAAAAGFAPSIHNTQPWRWRFTADTLELRLVLARVLPATDPERRMATMSCGVALHHARAALAAQGWHATVTRMPPGDDHSLLARLQVDGPAPASPVSVRYLRTIPLRHTDRRPATDIPVGPAALKAVATAVWGQDTGLHTLLPSQVLELAAAADHAQRDAAASPAWQAELAYWTGDSRPAEQDGAATFVMLHGSSDEPVSWLRAGEALSAGWLTATEHGVSVLPHSAPIEVDAARQVLRTMLAGVGHPLLLLRLGTAYPAGTDTTRLPAEQLIDRARP